MCANGNKCSERDKIEADRDNYFQVLATLYMKATLTKNEVITSYINENAPEVAKHMAEMESRYGLCRTA